MIRGNEFYLSWEPVFMEWMQSHMGTMATAFASLCTNFGESLFLVIILGYLYWCYDKEYAKYVGTNLVVGLIWNPMIKNVFNRKRPYFVHQNITCLRPVEAEADIYDIAAQGFSFPSGHSTCAVTAYGSIACYKKNRFLFLFDKRCCQDSQRRVLRIGILACYRFRIFHTKGINCHRFDNLWLHRSV